MGPGGRGGEEIRDAGSAHRERRDGNARKDQQARIENGRWRMAEYSSFAILHPLSSILVFPHQAASAMCCFTLTISPTRLSRASTTAGSNCRPRPSLMMLMQLSSGHAPLYGRLLES